MSSIRILLLTTVIVLLIPNVNASCPDPVMGRYPGWEVRFNGTLNITDIVKVEDFEVRLTEVYEANIVRVEIHRLGNLYADNSLMSGSDERLKKPDIWVELIKGNSGTNHPHANLTVYTPQRANISVNLTDIYAIRTVSDRNIFFPNEELYMEFTINNSGELGADNIRISPEFGDLQIVYTDAGETSLCPDSTYDFEYLLKAPNVRKSFNYTLYLKIEYEDYNTQMQKVGEYSQISSTDIEIVPSSLEIERSISNWTTASISRDLLVNVILNNTGDSRADNVQWNDNPPLDFLVTSGTTSWNGSIDEGKQRYLNYKIISDDPIICQSITRATYNDRFGNNYITYSDDATAIFDPYLILEKSMDGVSTYLSPDKSETTGNKTLRLREKVNVSIKVKNIGNAIARNVFINDTSGQLISGNNELSVELKPGEETSFEYQAEVVSKDTNFSTEMQYIGVDRDAFNASEEIKEETPNYCLKELKTLSYSTGTGLNVLYPGVSISSPSALTKLSEFEIDYNLTVNNNGTDGVHDVFIYIDTTDLMRAPIRYGGAILRGQPVYYLRELAPGDKQNFTLILRAPTVENKTSFDIIARVNYTDFFGDVHSTKSVTDLEILKPAPAFAIVKIIERGLDLTIEAPTETEIGEYGSGIISMEGVGFAPLENIELSFSLPSGFEFFSNDTAWEGRFEAQLRRENQTWFGYVDNIAWKGNLSTYATKKIEFLLRTSKAGIYNIPYNLTFDGDVIKGLIELKVRGPRLEIKKTLNKKSVAINKEIEVVVEVRNVGEAIANNVILIDKPPANFQTKGESTITVEELAPEEVTGVKYLMRSDQAGRYASGIATVQWTDSLGNEYLEESQEFTVAVQALIELPPELIKPPETTPSPPGTPPGPLLGRRDVIITSVFTVVIMTILIKLLAISRSSSKR